MLAHGHWWAFDVDAGSITVRATTDWPSDELHRDFTIAGIREATELFEQLEIELFFLQRHIEEREMVVCNVAESGWRSWVYAACADLKARFPFRLKNSASEK